MPETTPRVLIVGAGAIGSFYGAILHRGGAQVEVVSRSEADVIRDHGFRLHSRDMGDLTFRPAAVHERVEDVAEAPDFVLLSVKVLDDLDRAALIRPAVGPKTVIVLVENGIDIERPIHEAFPDNPLVSGLAFVAVSRTGKAQAEHKAYGRLVIGEYPSGAGNAAERLSALLTAGGIECPVSGNLVTERWRKAVWNAAFNPVSVIAGGATTTTILDAPGGEDFMVTLMQEVCDVAAAAGHPMPEELPVKSIGGTRKMPPYHNSMALDYLNGRPMEVEAILGNVIRAAESHGVDVPHLESVYRVTKMLQNRVATEG
ncbi:ketopantoate reductase family protein [Aquisalimonas asiatica]|uniref:2-dehydropantoate 2-reductase n=1 Tax=Aquisalimonas asiatica TaxID=406100 RepID=A0A1H8SQS8_9GAMM|nr:2-dehydropantoate 2-reductase [Aquisalimonas asiatica]SEO80925.1 2-dehydropantoate 2-reductase [Aquisalimonas asiatica]